MTHTQDAAVIVKIIASSDGENSPQEVVHHLLASLHKSGQINAWSDAPAVPDDVAETAKRLRQATFTKGRMRGGIIGQTIEAAMRSTFHEVSAWDLITAADALEAQAAELARLQMTTPSAPAPQSTQPPEAP